MNKYKLTFTVTFDEQDDPAARKQALKISEAIGKIVPESEAKLQQIYTDQPPRGVRLT